MSRTAAQSIRSRRSRLVFAASLVGLVGLGCDTTEPLRAVALGLVTQPPGTAQSGVELTQVPLVELRDRKGAAFAQPDVAVTVSIADGGGTLVGTTTRTTDASGRVEFPNLAIAGSVGPRTLRFSASGLSAVTSTSITLGPGLPATMQAVSPVSVEATVGTAVASLPSVVVKDASDNPVPGVTVTFTFAAGAVTQVTNASGVATVPAWTLPTSVGQYTAVATAADLTGTTITFTATATPGAPAAMTRTAGDGQSLLYGSRLATPLQVRVTDQYGNVTPGVVVTWGSATGAGTVEPINVATDADGIVRSNYRLGTTPGENVIRASITSRSLSTDFTATALGFTNQLEITGLHSCAIDESGVAYCWGLNDHGQLGDGTTVNRSTPTRVSGTLRFRRITTGGRLTCAVTTDNVPYCWGFGTYGQLGNGTKAHRMEPTPVSGGHLFAEISTGQDTACGMTSAGAVYCWGSNQVAQLGVGTGVQMETCTDPLNPSFPSFACSLVPLQVTGGLSFRLITVGFGHVCGLTSTASELYCWGLAWPYGGEGGVGDGLDRSPVRVAPTYTFAKVVATTSITCGIVAPSSAYCWGSGSNGEFGDGDETGHYHATPNLVPGIAAVDIHAGGMTCALVTDGRSFCWGFNIYGSVGDGTTITRASPTPVSTSLTFTTIRASIYHSCGRATNGQVHCWGANQDGELGVGDTFQRLTPTLTRP